MNNTLKRILAAIVMMLIATGAGIGEYYGLHTVRILSVSVVFGMIIEFILAIIHSKKNKIPTKNNRIKFIIFFVLLITMLLSANYVGTRPWIMLLILMTISAADIGAWYFGRIFGGDKMWERISANKTWAGQIAGIMCGTGASVLYGLLGTDTFMPQLLWIGISVSLLSQYGDLTASWIKRNIGIKDFGNILPGHGGLLDRFDGWIYVLPLIWFVMI
ncbi:MAG: phosphatidate cytidylyltransferase [Alphaproteobacteria bacterium]|nr:phosphatidate cytidylyltransferase [Alphaproteobacteria bacterium]